MIDTIEIVYVMAIAAGLCLMVAWYSTIDFAEVILPRD